MAHQPDDALLRHFPEKWPTWRSGCVALVVGTLLNLINQGDAIFAAKSINWTKIVLTYLVLYAVSTYGAVSYRMSRPPP